MNLSQETQNDKNFSVAISALLHHISSLTACQRKLNVYCITLRAFAERVLVDLKKVPLLPSKLSYLVRPMRGRSYTVTEIVKEDQQVNERAAKRWQRSWIWQHSWGTASLLHGHRLCCAGRDETDQVYPLNKLIHTPGINLKHVKAIGPPCWKALG